MAIAPGCEGGITMEEDRSVKYCVLQVIVSERGRVNGRSGKTVSLFAFDRAMADSGKDAGKEAGETEEVKVAEGRRLDEAEFISGLVAFVRSGGGGCELLR